MHFQLLCVSSLVTPVFFCFLVCEQVHPEEREVVRDCLNYFDIHNFADRIRSPIVVNLGLKDDVCPPETGFALFIQIGSDENYLYT